MITTLTHKDPIQWILTDSVGSQAAKGQVNINRFGAFDFSVNLPDTMNLGSCAIQFSHKLCGGCLIFQVEEFRRPEFELSSNIIPQRDHVATRSGSHVIASASATYFAGGPLTGANVQWNIKTQASPYRPPLWGEFSFGEPPQSQSLREFSRGRRKISENSVVELSTRLNFPGMTNESGSHDLKIAWEGTLRKPLRIDADAVITDKNNQALQTGSNFMVHPSAYYVGCRFTKKRNYGNPKVRK